MIEQVTIRTTAFEIFIDLVVNEYVVEVYSNETSRLVDKELFDTLQEAFNFVRKDYLGGNNDEL